MIVLVVGACRGESARDSDCAKVRAAFEGVPRRYRSGVMTDKLATETLRDADVDGAVHAGDVAKLESLCGLATRVEARTADCRLVALYIPSVEQESKGVAVFDPSVANAEFRDPQVRAAMKELADSKWTPFAPARATPDPRLAKLRELCGSAP